MTQLLLKGEQSSSCRIVPAALLANSTGTDNQEAARLRGSYRLYRGELAGQMQFEQEPLLLC
ncbi:hypothetical protein BSZ22_02110 [Bradyrhizobium canariense]|uniref:Uncharacterized protein n=1 Tax=Bradyrhizobium canariense TaxID=255045 RepID=A0A1X3G6D2_9BRAD|nr:hypothetical protein BSZ22_02110 [Bradyrhizobium canariense]OSI82314.1 hypothetical protein BSZ23_02115 [Bradyrhizobium canariense]OSI96579.1 hypothetical protein BSZ25_01770 [Bradyrhizobium canariense]OSI97861.1 hypothetical protein BSZ24_01810 [Bradyrhizobium canariense]OSJ15612.1 hypothetical protein BSZ16_01825 [Bradyrhizobium canariense]